MNIQDKINILSNYIRARRNNEWFQVDNLNELFADVQEFNQTSNSPQLSALLDELRGYMNTVSYVPTMEAANRTAGIDGRDFIDANPSAQTFMENGFEPIPPATYTSIPTQQAADVAAGIDGRDFIDATASAQTFMENGFEPIPPATYTSIPTQQAADIAAGIDGRDFIDATAAAQTFMENGFEPIKPLETTSIPTQQAADIAAGIDGRTFIDATAAAQAFVENGPTEYEKQLEAEERKELGGSLVQNLSAIREQKQVQEQVNNEVEKANKGINVVGNTEQLGNLVAPVFISNRTIGGDSPMPTVTTSIPTQQAADIAAGIDGRDFIDATASAQTFMENGFEPIKPLEHTSIPTQQAADIAAGIDGRDFIDATASAQTFMENGFEPIKPLEHTSIPTQQAADIAAGIDGRDFIDATASAQTFMENGFEPIKPLEHTSIPTQQAADIAAGIDGRTFIDATAAAQAFIENGPTEYEKQLEAEELGDTKEFLINPSKSTVTPVAFDEMPDHFITDTPEEKANELLNKVVGGEVEKPEWAQEYENDIKKAQINNGSGIDRKNENDNLIPVVLFKKAKEVLTSKTTKRIAAIAASVLLILALAKGCSNTNDKVAKEELPPQIPVIESVVPTVTPTPSADRIVASIPGQEDIVITPTPTPEPVKPVVQEPTTVVTPEPVKPEPVKPETIRPTNPGNGGGTYVPPVTPPVLEDLSDAILRTEENVVRTDNEGNKIVGNPTVLDEKGEEVKTPSGEFFALENDNNTVIIDSRGNATYIDVDGKSYDLGNKVDTTQEGVRLPDGTTANALDYNEVKEAAEEIAEQGTPVTPEEPDVPAATVITEQTATVIDPGIVDAGKAASAIDLPDPNAYGGDTNYEQAAEAMVEHMVNNPAEQSQGTGLGR